MWSNAVTRRNLQGKTVHTAELASGSKIGYDQFLLLRVLWKPGTSEIRIPEVNKFLPKANELLANYVSWKTYCDSFSTPRAPEGSFAVARHYQKMAANSDENTRPNTFVTPIAKRTRHKLRENIPDISKLQLVTPRTPEMKAVKPPQTPDVSSSIDDDDDDDVVPESEEGSSLDEPITPAGHVPDDLQSLMFPPTKDEQIVNTALVTFLNALTIHFDVSETCNWTAHRKGFTADFEEASFQARVDGYLDDGQENVYAIIEVKPVVRHKKNIPIQMQESAQMVGWILTEANRSVSNSKP